MHNNRSNSGSNEKISKNHLLHNVDSCKSINELFTLIQKYNIVIRMQTLPGASNIPMKKNTPTPTVTYLERLKRVVMQAVEEQYN